MKISCPTCSQHLEIDDELGGTQFECPTCKHSFITPSRQKCVSQAAQHDPREAWAARFKRICGITVVAAIVVLLVAFHFEEHLPRIVVSWLWIITFYVSAFVLLLAEAFIPGPMICAATSGVCLVIAIAICFFRVGAWMSLYLLIGTVPLFFGGLYWLLDRLPMFLGSGGTLSKGSDLAHDETVEACAALLGSSGMVFTPLQPQGTVMVDGSKWDAVSDSGEYMAKGMPIEVVGVDGATIPSLKVRKKPEENEQPN